MKKTALLLAIVMIFHIFAVNAIAAYERSDDNGVGTIENDGIGEIASCLYDPVSKRITISGRVSHDVMVTHSKYRLAVYRLNSTEKLSDVIYNAQVKPIATSDISAKFEFVVKEDSNRERFSRYSVVIYNDSGDIKAIGEPVFPNVAAEYAYEQGSRDYFKGISTELTSSAVNSSVSTAVIDVSFDSLLSNGNTGYLHSVNGNYIYFDKNYIGQLDAMVRSYTTTDTRVYLRFRLSGSGVSGITTIIGQSAMRSTIPNMGEDGNIDLISAFTEFLADRYSDPVSGRINGIILGETIERNYFSDLYPIDEFAANYAFYMIVVGNTARSVLPDVDIVMPFGDKDAYSQSSKERIASQILESVCGYFDKYLSEEFPFSTLIQSSVLPYGISDENIAEKSFDDKLYEGINADNTEIYSEYLKRIDGIYKNSPHEFIFMWDVDNTISGNELTAAYSYSYFKLLGNASVSSFVISLEKGENIMEYSQLPELMKIIKYIDTSKGFEVTGPQLELLGATDWKSVIDGMYEGKTDISSIIDILSRSSMPENIKGSFVYFDFSYYTNVSTWFGGYDCTSLQLNYNDVCGRALEAKFSGKTKAVNEYSEVYCYYEYPENFSFTTDLTLNLALQNEAGNENALYEVKVVFGKDKNISEMTTVCSAYEKITLILDIASFCEVSMTDYIRIGVRELTDTNGGYTLAVSSLTGYSTKYLSDELESLITEDRLLIRDMIDENNDGDSVGKSSDTVLFLIGIGIVVVVIGIGVIMCIRREEE